MSDHDWFGANTLAQRERELVRGGMTTEQARDQVNREEDARVEALIERLYPGAREANVAIRESIARMTSGVKPWQPPSMEQVLANLRALSRIRGA